MNTLTKVLVYYMSLLNFISFFSDLYRIKHKEKLKNSKTGFTTLFTILFSVCSLFTIYTFRSISDVYGQYYLLGFMVLFTIIGLAIMTVITLTNLYTIRKDVKNDYKINRINGARK